MKLLAAAFLLSPALVFSAPTPTKTPVPFPTPEWTVNIESTRMDKAGIDIQYRFHSPTFQVKGWDGIRVLRKAKESDKALYARATDAAVSVAMSRSAEFKAFQGTAAKPTPTATRIP